MAEIDRLDIKIAANAQIAVDSLDRLINKIKQVSDALGGIHFENFAKGLNATSVPGLENVANNIKNINTAMDKLSTKKTTVKVDADVRTVQKLREQLKQLQVPEIKENNLKKLQNELEKSKQKMASLKAELSNKLTMGKITASVDDSGYIRMREKIALTGKTIDALQNKIKNINTSLDRLSAKKTSVKVDADTVTAQQKIKNLANQFRDAGKGISFSTNVKDLEKQYGRLAVQLDKYAEKEAKMLATGNTDTKAFTNLQYDINAALNKMSELESKIHSVNSISQQRPGDIPIFNYNNKVPAIKTNQNIVPKLDTSTVENFSQKTSAAFEKIPETARYSVEAAQKSLNDALSKVRTKEPETGAFRNYTQEIKNAEAALKQLEKSGQGMGLDKWDEAYIALQKVKKEAKEYKAHLDNPTAGLDKDIEKTNSLGNRVEELKRKLDELKSRGLNFGDAEFDNTYRNLEKATQELNAYKNNLLNAEKEAPSFSEKFANAFSKIAGIIKNVSGAVASFSRKVMSAFSAAANSIKKASSTIVSFFNAFKSHLPFVDKVSSSFQRLISKIGGFKKLAPQIDKANKSANNLVATFGKLYAKYILLSRVFRFFGKIIGSAMDYIEEFNYFNVSLTKVAEENKQNFKKYGYESAEAYADSFKRRLTDLTAKMTGFNVDAKGELINTDVKNLGLNITQVTNFQSRIVQMTNSVGMLGEASISSAKGLTMLAGDLSSLANIPLSQVMNNLSSGLSGAAMAVKKYGIDISVATLNEQAAALGIEKTVQKMTQAEKEYLRVITMINQSKVAWGDLAKTINYSNKLLLVA